MGRVGRSRARRRCGSTVEQLICNRPGSGSIRVSDSTFYQVKPCKQLLPPFHPKLANWVKRGQSCLDFGRDRPNIAPRLHRSIIVSIGLVGALDGFLEAVCDHRQSPSCRSQVVAAPGCSVRVAHGHGHQRIGAARLGVHGAPAGAHIPQSNILDVVGLAPCLPVVGHGCGGRVPRPVLAVVSA